SSTTEPCPASTAAVSVTPTACTVQSFTNASARIARIGWHIAARGVRYASTIADWANHSADRYTNPIWYGTSHTTDNTNTRTATAACAAAPKVIAAANTETTQMSNDPGFVAISLIVRARRCDQSTTRPRPAVITPP